jgi:Zn-dependent protease
MKTILNPDVKVIYRNADEVFLKNTHNNVLISMSEGEFEVLTYYSKIQDSEKTIQFFQEKYDFDRDFLDALIKKSEEIEIIETEEYLLKKEKNSKSHSPFITYCILWLNRLSNFLRLRLTFVFSGNLRFYKIFTVDLKATYLDKVALSKFSQNSLLTVYWLILFFSIFTLSTLPTGRLSSDYISSLTPVNTFAAICTIVLGILISTFLHEFGHYLLYKRYGGETSEMGFALVLGILPFMYVSTNSLYLWKKKSNRIRVTGAGILVDFLLLITILDLFLVIQNQELVFLLLFFFYFIFVRIIFNLMPFIPATDGYFLLTDLISNPSLFYDAGKASKNTWQNIKELNFKSIKIKEYAYTFYIIGSYLFITAYYTLMSLIILFPLLIRLF